MDPIPSTHSPPGDGQLGDPSAWVAFAGRWTPMVRAYLRRLGCARGELDDLIMDVLVDTYAALGAAGGSEEAQILRRTARRVSTLHKRLMRHEVSARGAQDRIQVAVAPSRVASDRERLWVWLEALLGRLPARQRLAIERHVDEVPDTMTAVELGCTVGSVRTLRYKGMKALRLMAESAPPPAD